MKINKYRIEKAWICFKSNLKNKTGLYWSICLALHWFSDGFNFAGDN